MARTYYLADPQLSWAAVGLLHYMLSIEAEGETVHIADLAAMERGEGVFHPSQRDQTMFALDELRAIGYVTGNDDTTFRCYTHVEYE